MLMVYKIIMNRNKKSTKGPQRNTSYQPQKYVQVPQYQTRNRIKKTEIFLYDLLIS